MKKFLEAVSESEELRGKLKAVDESNAVAVALEIAKELGIPLTEADFEKSAPAGISDDELEAVSGGYAGDCFCIAGGAGWGKTSVKPGDSQSGERSMGCGCVAYGQGGDGVDQHTLCICVGMGNGDS